MAAVTKVGTPSVCTDTPCDAQRLPPLPVGEDIAAGDPCYIKSDGKIWRSFDGGSLGTSAEVHGWAPISAKVAGRQSLSLYRNVNMNYGSGLTPGAFYYLSTVGVIQTTVGATQTKPDRKSVV